MGIRTMNPIRAIRSSRLARIASPFPRLSRGGEQIDRTPASSPKQISSVRRDLGPDLQAARVAADVRRVSAWLIEAQVCPRGEESHHGDPPVRRYPSSPG